MKATAIINSPGGVFTPKDLKCCALAAQGHGFYLGQRQNIIIPGVPFNHSELQKLSDSIRSEDYHHHHSNVVCSHAAGGMGRDTDWAYDNDAYLEILSQLPHPPRYKVNLCSREQSLFPLFSGQLNFITANEEGYWHLALNAAHQRQLLPFLFRTHQVPQVIALIEHLHRPGALLDADTIMARLSNALIIDYQQARLALYAKHPRDFEGFHQMPNGKFSLNIFSNHELWDTDFVSALCDMAVSQGLGRIYVSAGRSLLIKHIEEPDCFEWQNLIGRHNVTLRHSEQALSWMVPAEKRELVALKERIIKRLHADGLSFEGLYIALDPAEFECGAQIIIRSQKCGDTNCYQVFHKEHFDYRQGTFICAGSDLDFDQLVTTLFSLRKTFFQHSVREPVVMMQALVPAQAPENKMHIYQCPNCLTQYHEKAGLPHRGIPGGTAFIDLPKDWVCELCETPKQDFTEMTQN